MFTEFPSVAVVSCNQIRSNLQMWLNLGQSEEHLKPQQFSTTIANWISVSVSGRLRVCVSVCLCVCVCEDMFCRRTVWLYLSWCVIGETFQPIRPWGAPSPPLVIAINLPTPSRYYIHLFFKLMDICPIHHMKKNIWPDKYDLKLLRIKVSADLMRSIRCSHAIGDISVRTPVALQHPVRT